MAILKTKPPIRHIPFKPEWVLYEDPDILVVDKPAGLLSVPGREADPSASLIGQIHTRYPDALIVHRLDMDTSGIMVLARNAQGHRALSKQFEQRQTKKQYQAICFGRPTQTKGSVNLPMRCDWENRPIQMIDFKQGKFAQTHWQLVEQMDRSFKVLLTPITGRSHQLRLHMKQLGHPILGDNLYADADSLNAALRLCLHASLLTFTHPTTAESLNFTHPAEFW
ncbi:MAG: pseudouridine synthase [Hydrogenovibrio sp.]|nr:pseudouridine synthase [Hydrogenovibrio sp.]